MEKILNNPRRGQVWQTAFSPWGKSVLSPCLILSGDRFNQNQAGLIIVLPAIVQDLNIRSHVRAAVNGNGPAADLYICCDEILTVSTDRCIEKTGEVSEKTLEEIRETVMLLLDL
ncbi:MAG: type II toxin-antitoxin system PemK/MazF family toxin [Balneolales bacterium]